MIAYNCYTLISIWLTSLFIFLGLGWRHPDVYNELKGSLSSTVLSSTVLSSTALSSTVDGFILIVDSPVVSSIVDRSTVHGATDDCSTTHGSTVDSSTSLSSTASTVKGAFSSTASIICRLSFSLYCTLQCR